MALQFNDLISLIKTVSRADASAPVAYSFQGTNYSYQDLNETLRKELNEFVGEYRHFREHRYEVYSLIERAIDEIVLLNLIALTHKGVSYKKVVGESENEPSIA